MNQFTFIIMCPNLDAILYYFVDNSNPYDLTVGIFTKHYPGSEQRRQGTEVKVISSLSKDGISGLEPLPFSQWKVTFSSECFQSSYKMCKFSHHLKHPVLF